MKTFTNNPKRPQVFVSQQPKTTQPPVPQQADAAPRPKSVSTATPTQEDIARRAYEIYIRQGCQEGQSEQNWKQAERELREENLED